MGAGDWQVGLDVAAGRYVVTAGTGQSGNFIVYDADGLPGTDEILGKSAAGGVPSVTVTLTNGEQIAIAGLSAVTFTKK